MSLSSQVNIPVLFLFVDTHGTVLVSASPSNQHQTVGGTHYLAAVQQSLHCCNLKKEGGVGVK